jgi:hypothetical protein
MKDNARVGSNGRMFDDGRVLIFSDAEGLPSIEAESRDGRRNVRSDGANGYFGNLAKASVVADRFDAEYYEHEYPDVDFACIEPIKHFLEIGWYEGRNPNAFFDTVTYLQAYPDVEHANINPYCHYLAVGAAEGRQAWSSVTPSIRARLFFGRPVVDWVSRITPHVEEEFYARQLGKPVPAGINLAAHYAFRGWREGKRPNPDFDQASVAREDVLKRYLVNPLLIRIEAGTREVESVKPATLSRPSIVGDPIDAEIANAGNLENEALDNSDTRSQMDLVASEFDAGYYRDRYPDIAESGVDPLEHFFYTGWREGRDPSAQFDMSFYLESCPDALAGAQNPFWHFLAVGRSEGRLGRAPERVQPAAEVQRGADNGAADQFALLQSEFDPAYYLAAYPDVAEAGVDPLKHFFFTGWQEGRSPNQGFDCRYYMTVNEDVREAGLNPFWHYLVSGRAEGRLPKRPGGYKRANIEAAVVPSKRPPIDPDSGETEIGLTQFASRLERIRKKRKAGLVVSLSHDCYTKVIGGTQIFISDEQKRFNKQDYGYLHISPQLARLALAPHSDRCLVRVIADGEYVGLVELQSLSSYLKAKHRYRRSARTILVVHCAFGFHVPDVVQLWRDLSPDRSVYWLHDYSSICQGFNLLRNDAEFCGAPPKESSACRVCVYGQERREHIAAMVALFETCQFDVLSPSRYTRDLWLRSSDLPHRSLAVHPHCRLLPVKQSRKRVGEDGPLRIAFLGYPAANKGWQIFEEIVQSLGENESIRFFHFAARNVATLPKVEFVRTEVTPDDRQAALMALAGRRIKILLLLSPWPETFSFVLYEAIAAGAYIFCLADSGNVADVVERKNVGKVFAGADDLVDFIRSGAAARFVSEADVVRPVYRTENCGTTASASIIAAKNS